MAPSGNSATNGGTAAAARPSARASITGTSGQGLGQRQTRGTDACSVTAYSPSADRRQRAREDELLEQRCLSLGVKRLPAVEVEAEFEPLGVLAGRLRQVDFERGAVDAQSDAADLPQE